MMDHLSISIFVSYVKMNKFIILEREYVIMVDYFVSFCFILVKKKINERWCLQSNNDTHLFSLSLSIILLYSGAEFAKVERRIAHILEQFISLKRTTQSIEIDLE